MTTATIRDLRTRFPRLKVLLEHEGQIVITDRGRPAFVLRAFEKPPECVERVDYYERLRSRQPRPLSVRASRALDEANRGER
jgi:antitoxin (DNA-binding transcriptional repressor) of toxin-antitoxin stability system